MPKNHRLYRVLSPLIALLLMVTVSSGVATAQAESYEFETSGQVITWEAPWVQDEEFTFVEDDVESVGFSQGLSILSVFSIPNSFPIEESRDIVLEAFEESFENFTQIDRGSYDNISYSLDVTEIDGIRFGLFTLFRGGSGDVPTNAYTFISEQSAFANDLVSAQDSFLVDGSPIFTGVDGQGLEDQVRAVEAGTGAEPSTGETEPAEEEEGQERPPDDEATADDPAEDEPVDDDRADAGDFDDLGLVEDGIYESPTWGTEVLYSEEYDLDTALDDPITSEDGVDVINLAATGDTPSLVRISLAEGTVVPEDFIANVEDTLDEDTVVVASDSGRDAGALIAVQELGDGGEIVLYFEIVNIDDEHSALIIAYASTDAAEESFDLASSEIEVGGEPILTIFSGADVADELP